MSGPCTDCGGPDYQTLVSRIAALETELKAWRKMIAQMDGLRLEQVARAEQAEAALVALKEYAADGDEKLRQAEAALEERDRMLRWLWEHTPKVNYSYEQWLADLRTRASAAPESGFECNDICESCEWYAPGTDQGPCTTDDPREQPDNCPRAEEGSGK